MAKKIKAQRAGEIDFSWSEEKHWEVINIPKVRGVEHLVVYDTGKYLELELLHVKKDKRNQGIGGKMVGRIQGLKKPIHVMADAEPGQNARLRKFYMSYGFLPLGKNTFVWIPA